MILPPAQTLNNCDILGVRKLMTQFLVVKRNNAYRLIENDLDAMKTFTNKTKPVCDKGLKYKIPEISDPVMEDVHRLRIVAQRILTGETFNEQVKSHAGKIYKHLENFHLKLKETGQKVTMRHVLKFYQNVTKIKS